MTTAQKHKVARRKLSLLQLSQEIEDAILAYSLEHPTHGAQRTADELMLQGVQVSSGGVRGVWSRHNLLTQHERLLRLEEIEHRITKVRRPQSNGFIERFHRTLLDEHLRVKGRTTWYESVDEMQADLDAYLEVHNTKRPHRGRKMVEPVQRVPVKSLPRARSPFVTVKNRIHQRQGHLIDLLLIVPHGSLRSSMLKTLS